MPRLICPYKSTNTKTCTHRGTKKNRGGKRACGYKHYHNCHFFVEWIESTAKPIKGDSERFKSPATTIGELTYGRTL